MVHVQMVNNHNMLIASLLLLSLGAMPVYADGAGIEWETPGQELLALCKTPEATPKAVETLLKAGADVNTRYEDGLTPLIHAVSHNSNSAIIETLLKAGANIKAKDNEGKTAIDYAKENEKIYKTKAYWKLNDALYE